MKTLVALSLLVTICSAYYYPLAYNYAPYAHNLVHSYKPAKPFAYGYTTAHAYPYAYNAYPYAYNYAPYAHAYAPAVSSQHHAQDEFGNYNYGYTGALSSKTESKDAYGVTHGSYSFLDANNKVQTVNYYADPVTGFHVKATNLPVASNEQPEAPSVDLVSIAAELKAPEPVMDTAEVKAAKAEFQKLYDEAAAAADAAPDTRKKRSVVSLVHPVRTLPLLRPYAVHAPALKEAKVKTAHFETVDAAVPASTKKIELKEKEHTIKVPAYPLLHHSYAPLTYVY